MLANQLRVLGSVLVKVTADICIEEAPPRTLYKGSPSERRLCSTLPMLCVEILTLSNVSSWDSDDKLSFFSEI